MTKEEVIKSIGQIPIGSKMEIIKTNGDIIQVRLASHEVEGLEKKKYSGLEIPELPPAIIVTGGTRFGKFRIEIEEIVKIARVE